MARRRKAMAFSRRPGEVQNWIVGGDSVSATGAPGGAQTSWGGALSMAPGVTLGFLAISITPAAGAGTPSVGRLRIDEVKGNICFANPSVAGSYVAAVGLVVVDLNNTTTLWSMRSIISASDAARDDYLFLEQKFASLPIQVGATGNTALEFELKLKQPVIIGGGQALMAFVSNGFASVGSLTAVASFRTRIGPVS